MDVYNELINTAQLLKTVSVTGEYWIAMAGCLNSVLKVAEYIKQKEAEKNDAINNGAGAKSKAPESVCNSTRSTK